MADLVYPPVIGLARTAFLALGMKTTVIGAENLPRHGPAVLASNHVSYLDFIFVGLAGRSSHRLVRFMAKEGVFRDRFAGPLMRGMHHIPVDRDAGTASFRLAMKALKDGEVVGIFPEATISRSFAVKEIKSGAVRLAQATRAPLLPVAVWGGQRMFTKGRPKDLTSRGRHVLIEVGAPLETPRGTDGDELTTQ